MSIFSKRIVFLTKITDRNRDYRDKHLTRRRVPAPNFHAEFETEIVHRQVHRHDEDVSAQLPPTVQPRCSESHVFLQPETRQQGNRKHYTQRRDMRRDRLRELITEY